MLGLFLALVILFFHQALFTDQVFFNDDIGGQFLPWRYFMHRWADRALPFWCPLMYAGYPLLAEGEIGFFYPLNFLFYLGLSPAQAHKYVTVLHYLLAGLFTYLYAVTLRLRPLAAWLAAVVFTFSGFMVAQLVHASLLSAAIWLPLILLCLERAWTPPPAPQLGGRWSYVLAGGVVFAIQLFAGHPQISFYTALAAGLYLLVAAISREQPGPVGRRWGRGVWMWTGLLATGGLLAAIQLVPIRELAAQTSRVRESYAYVTQYSLPLDHLILLLFPYWFGSPINESYSGQWNFWEMSGFVGVLPLVVGVVAMVQTRGRVPRYFSLLALLSLVLALGGSTPLYRLLAHVPGFNLFRCPARYLYLFSFSLALLSGFGLNEFLRRYPENPSTGRTQALRILGLALLLGLGLGLSVWRQPLSRIGRMLARNLVYAHPSQYEVFENEVLATAGSREAKVVPLSRGLEDTWSLLLVMTAGTLLFLLCRRKVLSPRAWAGGVIGLTALELFRFGMGLNPVIPPDFYETIPETVQFLRQTPALLRVYYWNTGAYHLDHGSSYHLALDQEPLFKRREMLYDATGLIYGIPTLHGHMALHFERYDQWLELINRALGSTQASERSKGAKLLGMLCGQYVITSGSLPGPVFKRVYEREGLRIYRHREVQPRVTLARDVLVAADAGQAFAWLQQPAFDPQSQVILEEKPESVPPPGPVLASETVVITQEHSTRITLATSTAQPAFLVLHDQFYPGWKAFVDGVETKVYRADYVLRAIGLPAGQHTVEFVFEPTSYLVGRGLSLATLGGLGLLLLIHVGVRRRNRRIPRLVAGDG